VILDLVLNHTGESDVHGGVLSLRGLDDAAYATCARRQPDQRYRLRQHARFRQSGHVRALALDTLRHFVRHCGVDGFRFDLAPVLARGPGFDAADAPIFAEIAADPLLADRVMIAEPWDIGPGGYQLGRFPAELARMERSLPRRCAPLLARRWRPSARWPRGWRDRPTCSGADCRSVNFLAAHDGFTLADYCGVCEPPQPGQRRGQPRRPRREFQLEQRRRGPQR
jgi:glycogen operon protein